MRLGVERTLVGGELIRGDIVSGFVGADFLDTDNEGRPLGRDGRGGRSRLRARRPQRHIGSVRRLNAHGASLEESVNAASTLPARILGDSTLGSLEPGLHADVVVLTDELEVARVLVAGRDALG